MSVEPHPQYKVCWIQDHACKACESKSRQQFTFSFFKPEAALELATYVLKQGHTLLYVDQ